MTFPKKCKGPKVAITTLITVLYSALVLAEDQRRSSLKGSVGRLASLTHSNAQEVTVSDESSSHHSGPDPNTTSINSRKVGLTVGQTTTIHLNTLPRKVYTNKALVDAIVNKNDPNELIIAALDTPGIAEIIVVDRKGNQVHIEVTITQDTAALQRVISTLFPSANVEVMPVYDASVMIFGHVENAAEVGLIMEIASKFYPEPINALRVVGSQQVQVRVLVAEVSRTKLRSMGFNFLYGKIDSDVKYLTSTIGNLVSLSRTTSGAGASGIDFSFSDSSNVAFGKLSADREFRGFLQALIQEGIAKVLAETALVTFSGRAANMIVGGEFPIIVPGEAGTFSVDFREFGNKLDIIPTVLGGGRVRLEVRPEISELDFSQGVTLGGFVIPAIKQRRADTSIELNSGETFVIAGLLSTIDTASTKKVPYLADVPFLGAGFRTMQYSREEKELIIMVTPELAEPMTPDEKPCSHPGSESTHPSNHELFLLGTIESPICGDCQTARRQQVELEKQHSEAIRGITPILTEKDNSPRKEAVIATPQNASSKDAEHHPAVQIITEEPGLLGPLGYEGGR